MDEVTAFLTNLPCQSSVYVVYALQEETIHVLSVDVSSKYSVIRDMRSELVSQIAENGSGSGRVAVGDGLFATPLQRMLLEHIDEEMMADHYQGSDKAGFYNGVPGGMIMRHFCEDTVVPGLEMIDLMYPYTRYHVTEEKLRDEIRVMPVARDAVYGPVELIGGGATGTLGVSMNMRHFPPSPYIITKIDLLCCLTEHQFHQEYIFCEKMLTSEMTREELEQVRNSAVNILRLMVNHRTGYEPIDPHVHDIISRSVAHEWRVQMHDHIVID